MSKFGNHVHTHTTHFGNTAGLTVPMAKPIDYKWVQVAAQALTALAVSLERAAVVMDGVLVACNNLIIHERLILSPRDTARLVKPSIM